MSINGHNVRRTFPAWLFRHESLSPKMLEGLDRLNAEEFSKTHYNGLCILVEAVVMSVVPDLHRSYPGNALHEGSDLCGELLRRLALPKKEETAARLMLSDIDRLTPNKLLSFYLRLREMQLDAERAAALARQSNA